MVARTRLFSGARFALSLTLPPHFDLPGKPIQRDRAGWVEKFEMRFCYNILFAVFFWLSSPFYFLKMWRRGNWQAGFGQRFGQYSSKVKQAITNRQCVWFHAVSVGEVNVCTQLIKALEPRAPNVKIVVSTTTTTGMGELQKKLPLHISKIYYPVDLRSAVGKALGTIHPYAIMLVEAEIWPNFLWRAFDRDIPVFLVNARLSEKSYRGYKRFKFLFGPIFAKFAGVGCQNEEDAARLRELGFRPEVIHVFGSLKFDAARLDEKRHLDIPGLLGQLGATGGFQLLVGGSTHAGEEAVLGRVYLKLKKKFPKLFLVVVPRHFERGREAGRDLTEAGLKIIFRSEIVNRTQYDPGTIDALLVNTTGELRHFYEFADVVFVGKSLTAEGGQNPIEPAAMGKPVVFGPHMQNFEAISKAFVAEGAARMVRDEAELERSLEELLADAGLRERMGGIAKKVVHANRGGVERTVEMILPHLAESNIYVAPDV